MLLILNNKREKEKNLYIPNGFCTTKVLSHIFDATYWYSWKQSSQMRSGPLTSGHQYRELPAWISSSQ